MKDRTKVCNENLYATRDSQKSFNRYVWRKRLNNYVFEPVLFLAMLGLIGWVYYVVSKFSI